jgi:hypothetical protein
MKIKFLSIVLLIFITCVSNSHAQDAPVWKKGDKVEVQNMSKEWVRATILEVVDWRQYGKGYAYRIETEDPKAPNTMWTATVETIRAVGGVQKGPGQNDANNNVAGNFKVGDLVDTYYDRNRGHNRGTVIAVGDRKYKVHYRGCGSYFDEWVDANLVTAPNTISADDPLIRFLIGKWSLTRVTMGMDKSGSWGKVPGVEIKADGTYTWYQGNGKTPVKGTWITDAKVLKLDMGTPKYDGIILKDEDGKEWKAFRWLKNDGTDGIEIDMMCSNSSVVGRRVR